MSSKFQDNCLQAIHYITRYDAQALVQPRLKYKPNLHQCQTLKTVATHDLDMM
jgi:hypothetical protein